MKKRCLLLLFMAFILFVGCDKKVEDKKSDDKKAVEVIVYDKEKEIVYEKKLETEKSKLSDIIKNIDGLNIESENGQYGEFIVAINNVRQEDGYYWVYYVNDEYATVGVESYSVKNNDKVEFKLESFE